MKVLVVYAHPNPKSFNHAILESLTRGLEEGGHSSEVVDLYGIGFDPCLKMEDFAQFGEGQMPGDVLEQQKKVAEADALVFTYPVWWWGLPAMLKGWFDRVLSHGFAYRMTKKGGIEGLLKHKKVLLLNTTMADEGYYVSSGVRDAMKKLIDDASLKFCGIQNVEHVFLYAAATDAEARKKHLELAYRLGKEF